MAIIYDNTEQELIYIAHVKYFTKFINNITGTEIINKITKNSFSNLQIKQLQPTQTYEKIMEMYPLSPIKTYVFNIYAKKFAVDFIGITHDEFKKC